MAGFCKTVTSSASAKARDEARAELGKKSVFSIKSLPELVIQAFSLCLHRLLLFCLSKKMTMSQMVVHLLMMVIVKMLSFQMVYLLTL